MAAVESLDGFPEVGMLVANREWVLPTMPVHEVVETFFDATHLDAVAVVNDGRPLGLLTRQKSFFKLFRRYGYELYSKRPVILLADKYPMKVHTSEKLDDVLKLAMLRAPDDVYDEIVVTEDDGSFNGLLSIKRMIVEQSSTLASILMDKEIARAKAKELEEIGRVKSEFIAHVTHELRSPVNAILELGELMRMASERGHVEQLRDRLALLLSSATNLRSVITNILDLSKMEAGRMEVLAERFDLVPMIREVADTTRVLLGSKPVDIETAWPESPFWISSDPVKLRQVLINFTSNASKFTEQGKIRISVARDGDSVLISVSDTGMGIKEEDQHKLFIAFSQLENVRTKRYEGTGLGLAISKRMVGLLGGTIQLQSAAGIGSTFTIRLPAKKGEEDEQNDSDRGRRQAPPGSDEEPA